MSFIWPQMLVLLVIATPLLIWGYVSLVRRRAERAAALAAQGFVPTAATRRKRARRHVPFAIFLTALVLLLFGLARPEVRIGVPHREGTVVLAFDVSNSMKANDLKPTRMDAAKAAARAFVEKQPKNIRIAVVAFSDGGVVTQQPTTVRSDVLAAIDRLKPAGATSLGQGIFTSLSAIAGKPLAIDPNADLGEGTKVDIGFYGSASIVLLSDGENTSRPDPLDIAQIASVAGVHIYPIGLGSTAGTVVDIDGFKVATALDEEELKTIASDTGGTYFNAQDATSLAKIYKSIHLEVKTQPLKTEMTALVTGIAVALLVIGGALSLLWFGRVV